MNKTVLVIVTLALAVSIGIVFMSGGWNTTDQGLKEQVQNVEVVDGVQYITINAKGGYSPKVSTAAAGIPTKLIIKTNNTYDCSLALVIRSVNFQKMLSQTGEEVIDIGAPTAGEPLRGLCSMGMYNFVVNFN